MPGALPIFSDLPNTTITVQRYTYTAGWYSVDDLTALRALPTSSGNKSAAVKDADGGGFAIYYWNSSSSAADDGLLTIAPSDGGVGRWIRGV